ncbi:hypothetical protein KW797_00885 [Candidatus Parcubacteria bacterium]|nr:hypothetical protein [Candidatus Parcubacteria bacterium]
MKVTIVGKEKEKIEGLVAKTGFSFDDTAPDMVISYGGDGTLMRAEAAYPGIPKVALKNSQICKKCSPFANEEVLAKLKNENYAIEELPKLEAEMEGKKLIGLNDIVVHNKDSRHAIRYRIKVNGKDLGHEIIGDGIVVATPFGSTGYFRSITDSFFEVGIGLAFNNSTEQSDHMILKEGSSIEMEIVRGPVVVYADNQEGGVSLESGKRLTIRKSAATAKIVVPR